MTDKTILKTIMKLRGFTYGSLATKLGFKHRSNVSNTICGDKAMSVDRLLMLLEAMDCELVIKSKLADKSTWVVSKED